MSATLRACGLGWIAAFALVVDAQPPPADATATDGTPFLHTSPPVLGGIRIHGYGELHYNRLEGRGGAADKDELDLHRFVVGLGADLSDRVRFDSELELEHALAGEREQNRGYLQVEEARLDFDLNERHAVRAGVFLVPVGLLNTMHEPTGFYGVERNPVENRILPTTWSEGGIGLAGDLGGGWRYEAWLHSGLNIPTGSHYSVRSGRQKASYARATDPAATVALAWSGPGINVGGAVHHQRDVAQGQDPEAGAAWLWEVHADLRRGPFGLRGLFAQWTLNGAGPRAAGADRQYGGYLEPSMRLTDRIGIFVCFN